MNAIEQHDPQHTEPAERPVLLREFPTEISAGDGRTIDVRVVPYGEKAFANDGFGGVARGITYEEEWVPGAFADQVRASETAGRAKKVLVNFEHQPSLRDVVGHGIALREQSDGLYGSFVLHDTPDGDKALMLVREGILEGISLEARPLARAIRSRDGVVRRVKAHLHGIALCRTPAFAGAQVLALREEQIEEEYLIAEEFLLPELNPDVVERCRHLGIKLPQRYQAHPEETDTPAETGTSEDGTRPNP